MRITARLAASGLVAALAACATTKLSSTWRDPGFQPDAPRKAVVMAVVKDASVRRMLEDAYVSQLAQKGVAGVQSYTFASDRLADKERLAQEVERAGADLVIVTALVDKKRTETYVPPSTPSPSYGYYGYYSTRWDSMTPGYTFTTDEAITETKAFDAREQKLVWSARAETVIDQASSQAMVDEFVEKTLDSLFKGRKAPPGA